MLHIKCLIVVIIIRVWLLSDCLTRAAAFDKAAVFDDSSYFTLTLYSAILTQHSAKLTQCSAILTQHSAK